MHFKVIAPLALMLALTVVACSDDKDDDHHQNPGDSDNTGDVDNGTPPTITSFTAAPAAITPGTSTILTWAVGNATSVTLQGAAATGTSMLVSPAATTTYTLVATNAAGSVDADVTVTVSAGASTVPASPISYNKNQFFSIQNDILDWTTLPPTPRPDQDNTVDWLIVPNSYDDTHATPTRLLVWLHGCDGESRFEVGWLSPAGDDQTWITLSPGGAEGGCWEMNTVTEIVLRSITRLKTRFNIDPKRVFIGGYSSGGDGAYRIAFYNALQFAGVLAENTSPFRDTKSPEADSLAAAAWKFNVVHLAHTEDTTYLIAAVEAEVNAMDAAGFPVMLVKRQGGHYDVPGTIDDARTYLMPQLSGGWVAP